jgi:hypothetical protein
MSERVINDPTVAGWELNPDTGYWMWAAGSGGYDDTEIRGLIADNTAGIATNASNISGNSSRIDALEAGGGGSSYTAGNGITIDGDEIKMSGSYSGTFTANTVVGSG